MTQVFISYSRVDKAFAQRLADDLRKNQYTVWLDVQSIPHGANWDSEIQRGLDASDVTLVLLSPSAAASQNVADEWSHAIEKGKRIIPLMIQPCDVPFRLSRRQRVDFIQGYDQGLVELLKALQEPNPGSTDAPRQPDVATKPLKVAWGERYHWWSGLGPTINSGDATVTSSELRLIAPQQLPFFIPLTSLQSAQLVHLRWDTYLALSFLDHADQPHDLIVMGTQRATREITETELLNALQLYSGRTLDRKKKD